MKQFTNQYLELLQKFRKEKIIVDSDIEDNMKEFLETSFYLIKDGKNSKPSPLIIKEKKAVVTAVSPNTQRSLSPIMMR